MTCIDIHAHWASDDYVERLRSEAASSTKFAAVFNRSLNNVYAAGSKLHDMSARVGLMDEAGIDVSVISLAGPAATFGVPATRAQVARETNDAMLSVADDHAGRFDVLVSLPFPDTDASLAELERVAGHPHARGVYVLATVEEWTPDDVRLDPVYRRAAELGMPVMLHPSPVELPEAWNDWMLQASLAMVVSSSLAAARMILSGTLDRIDELDVIVPHLGGVLPYLSQRMNDFGRGAAQHELSHYLRHRLYVDSCSYHPPAFHCAVETVGVERIVLGSDYPNRGSLQRAIDDVLSVVPSEHERQLVLGGTASRWFG